MNEALIKAVVTLCERSARTMIQEFDSRVKEIGLRKTRMSFGIYAGGTVSQILEESHILGAPQVATTIEAMFALVTATVLDLSERGATIVIKDNGDYEIYEDGELWIAGNTDTLDSSTDGQPANSAN